MFPTPTNCPIVSLYNNRFVLTTTTIANDLFSVSCWGEGGWGCAQGRQRTSGAAAAVHFAAQQRRATAQRVFLRATLPWREGRASGQRSPLRLQRVTQPAGKRCSGGTSGGWGEATRGALPVRWAARPAHVFVLMPRKRPNRRCRVWKRLGVWASVIGCQPHGWARVKRHG